MFSHAFWPRLNPHRTSVSSRKSGLHKENRRRVGCEPLLMTVLVTFQKIAWDATHDCDRNESQSPNEALNRNIAFSELPKLKPKRISRSALVRNVAYLSIVRGSSCFERTVHSSNMFGDVRTSSIQFCCVSKALRGIRLCRMID